MKCKHENEEIKEYRIVKAMVVECRDCWHMRLVVLCECCGQGEVVQIHHCEHEHGGGDYFVGVCEKCKSDFRMRIKD